MDRETTLVFIVTVASVYLWFLAVLVWGIWIQRYVERNGRETASLSLTWFTGWSVLLDYRTARCIAAEQGCTPWFLRCFAWLAGLGTAGVVTTIMGLCVSAFH